MAFSGFVFLDTETTGINPRTETVLEIGIVLVDADYNEIDSKYWITKTVRSSEVFRQMYARHDYSYVKEMHVKSGLKEEFEQCREFNRALYVDSITTWLYDRDADKMPMCGNTIGFDREFLKEHYPEVNDIFHYRSIDVSSIREFYNVRYPAVAEKVKGRVEEVMGHKDVKHRTISDCRWSMETLRAFDELSMGQVSLDR